MSKEPVVKRGAKEPTAKKPVVKLPAKKASASKRSEAGRASLPAAKRSPSVEALLSLAGTITEEEAEALREALRQSRTEGCEA
jgi:hypothetical protein